ncbi:1864_t:CDS:1 [Acaulospora morrowiae]|uniref:1864_t:CDS:1 n=1 Tax=Acaulospora morrowiae TaxID=94023 RepID=A0A9N9BV63_9GLOM|nr:1864_t:CDS:1 [Acaulospora morrowiae]
MSKEMVVRDQQNCKVELPFPPPITVDEIIEKHLKNGVENVNKTSNAFLIYRMVYNNEAKELGLPLEDISKLSGNSWKNEPEHIKTCYKEIASAVKSRFKIKSPLCFINIQKSQLDDENKRFDEEGPKIADNTAVSDNQVSPVMPPVNEQEFVNSLPSELAMTYLELSQSIDAEMQGIWTGTD